MGTGPECEAHVLIAQRSTLNQIKRGEQMMLKVHPFNWEDSGVSAPRASPIIVIVTTHLLQGLWRSGIEKTYGL